jgi:hypothetical protein
MNLDNFDIVIFFQKFLVSEIDSFAKKYKFGEIVKMTKMPIPNFCRILLEKQIDKIKQFVCSTS